VLVLIRIQALDVLSLMLASYLYTLCQALDLRAMNMEFSKSIKSLVETLNSAHFNEILEPVDMATLNNAIWVEFENAMETTTSRDSLVSTVLHTMTLH